MRSLRLALALSLLGASSCSLLLDTEALQKKTGAGGTGGSGGSGGAGDIDGGRDAGASCSSDIDCQNPTKVEGCTRYQCGTDKTCLPPAPHSGLGVISVATAAGEVETADQADEIGYPSLLADGTDLVLGFWKRNAMTSNVVLRRYDERVDISPMSADLNAISSNRFDSLASSPGLSMRNAPRRIRLLGAAKLAGAAATAMYQMEVDLATFRVSNMQPTRQDLGITGFDVNPRGPAPRLLPAALAEPPGMWMQQGKLYYFDTNTMPGEVYSTKRVIGFAPLAAFAGVHAAIESTELTSTDDQGETELWTRGSNVLTSLIGDVPGGRRRGVATTATAEGTAPINFVLWSFERAGTPSLLYAASTCDGMQCGAVGGPPGSGTTLAATAPAAASARVNGSMAERDLATIFQVTGPDPTRPTVMNTAIVGGLARLSTTTVDGGPSIGATALNPANFLVTLTDQPPASLGPASVAMTSGGLMMVAWVERSPSQAVVKTRRFRVTSCP